MNSNIFIPSAKSSLRKLLELHRLNLGLKWTMVKYFVKSALKLKLTEDEKNVNYYYLTLINCECCHLEKASDKLYFARENLFFVARSGVNFSDLENLNQIFGRKEYKEITELYRNYFKEEPAYIIDAGANVGYATLYFHSIFLTATYISIEPDESNYAILEENCKLNKMGKSYLLNQGLWSSDVFLELAKESANKGTWGFSYIESNVPTKIHAMDFRKLLRDRNFATIDILKIDIEGAEKILFNNQEYMKDILAVTKVIGIEIHDHMADRLNILNQLKSAGFILHDAGDMTFGYNSLLKNRFSESI